MNQQWYWHEQDYPYLTCKLLSSWQHGFFTAQFYPQTPSELTQILQPQTEAYRVKQIHGNLVLTPQEINQIVNQDNYSDSLAEADAVISDRSTQSVWVASADCTPVLIGDLATGRVAAIHAGWRGTALKIVPQAIARFLKFGSQRKDLRIALGPAISGQMYQVDQSVAFKVGQSIIDSAEKSLEAAIAQLRQLYPKAILDDELPGKVRLDVALINQIQLEQLGLSSEQIAIAPYCTYSSGDQHRHNKQHHFFSYRRTGAKKVQWSGIVAP